MKKSISLLIGSRLFENLLSAQFVKEWSVGEEAILILGISQRFQRLGTIFLRDFITHERQESLKLSQHHGAIFIFVVQFAQFNKVMVVSSVFRLSNNFLGKFNNLIEFAELLLNIVSLAVLDANLLGEVHAHGVEDIHEVVHVKDTLAMPIIDVADSLNFISINRHGWLILFDLFQKTFRQLPTPRPSC